MIRRTTAIWSGAPGLPGYTTMYWDGTLDGSAALSAMKTLMTDLLGAGATGNSTYVPAAIDINFDTNTELIDEATGEMVSFESATAQPPIGGSGSKVYAAVSGACISWYTAGVANGRRVRGRTFLVPLQDQAFASDGSLSVSLLADLAAGGNGAVAAGELQVWHRPSGPGATDGFAHPVTAWRATDQAAYLKSRRN